MFSNPLRNIGPIFRHSVAYLVQEVVNWETGSNCRIALATAFFIHVRLKGELVAGYLVTARHNLEEARKDRDLYLRANLYDGAFIDEQIPHIQDWFQHPTTDVALLPYMPPKGSKFMSIPSE